MEDKSIIRIVDIARLAGVSVGTVDRVLHNRGRVSEEKRTKIEEVLKEINYEPNMVARFLASKKDYTFAVLIPSFTKGEYWELVTDGIDKATIELKNFNVTVEYFFFDQQDESSFNKTVQSLLQREFAGVVIATIFGERVIGLSRKLEEKEIPYIYIDSDILSQHNLAYFGADSHMSGTIAAKLMLGEIGKSGDIIIGKIRYKGTSNSVQMETREQGFKEYLKNNQFVGHIHYLEIDSEKNEDVLRDLKNIVPKLGDEVGAIVFNSRIYELVELFNNLNPDLKKLKLIGYDSIEKNVEALKNDQVSFLISQRSIQQGYDAIKSLSNYLLFSKNINKTNFMPIDILMKENIEYYKNYKL